MNNQEEKNHIADKVLSKIKSGEVKMRPRLYFILETALVILGALLIGIFLLFLISFISFQLRTSGVWFLPSFGLRGFGMFLGYLPWLLIIVALLLILVLEILVKRFSFIYHKPVLYSLLVIILIVFLGGLLIDKTPFHSNLFMRAKEDRLPIAGHMYRGLGAPQFHDVHRGNVSQVTENGFIIENPRGDSFTVIIDSETKLPPDFELKEGDNVVVLGKEINGTINATDIHETTDSPGIFPLPHPSSTPPPSGPLDRVPGRPNKG